MNECVTECKRICVWECVRCWSQVIVCSGVFAHHKKKKRKLVFAVRVLVVHLFFCYGSSFDVRRWMWNAAHSLTSLRETEKMDAINLFSCIFVQFSMLPSSDSMKLHDTIAICVCCDMAPLNANNHGTQCDWKRHRDDDEPKLRLKRAAIQMSVNCIELVSFVQVRPEHQSGCQAEFIALYSWRTVAHIVLLTDE